MNICDKCDTINLDTALNCSSCDQSLAPEGFGSTPIGDGTIGDGYLAALHQRPTSLTVLCWLIIGLGSLSLLRLPGQFSDPAMQSYMHLLYLDVVIIPLNIWAAVAMLSGKVWGRTVTVLIRSVLLCLVLATSFAAAMLSGAFFVIVLMILYSADANAFFSRSRHSL